MNQPKTMTGGRTLLFERLIDPQERYQWGQHYTNPDVVDLMLSLAIPDGAGTVMDGKSVDLAVQAGASFIASPV